MELDTTITTPLQMDQVFRSTRWLAIFIIPFLVAASAILFIWPADTGRLFAWPIKPTMTAMMLGSAYMGGIYFFGRVAFARQWHTVKIGLPVTTFAGLLGIATLLHWDKFSQGHISYPDQRRSGLGDFKPANAGTYLFVGGLSALLVFLAGLYLWMQSQPPSTGR